MRATMVGEGAGEGGTTVSGLGIKVSVGTVMGVAAGSVGTIVAVKDGSGVDRAFPRDGAGVGEEGGGAITLAESEAAHPARRRQSNRTARDQ